MNTESSTTPAPVASEPSGVNRYRLQLKHPQVDGVDVEVLATDEADALAQAEALVPEGTTFERVVPLEINVKTPEQQAAEAPEPVEGGEPPAPPPELPPLEEQLAPFLEAYAKLPPKPEPLAPPAPPPEQAAEQAPA